MPKKKPHPGGRKRSIGVAEMSPHTKNDYFNQKLKEHRSRKSESPAVSSPAASRSLSFIAASCNKQEVSNSGRATGHWRVSSVDEAGDIRTEPGVTPQVAKTKEERRRQSKSLMKKKRKKEKLSKLRKCAVPK